ncbi:MAG: response regulator [Planctomycetota bacterium]
MAARSRNLRVLVVDDDHRCRDSLGALLEHEGFDILSAGGGNQALDVLRQGVAPGPTFVPAQRVDVHFLVLDYNMPDLTGLEVLRVIRSELQVVIPAILVSGECSPDLERSVRSEGVFALAEKPIEPVSFRELVRSLVKFWFPED